MTKLILFVGPTRSSTTSLYERQRNSVRLSAPHNASFWVSKFKSKEHYFFDTENSYVGDELVARYLKLSFRPSADLHIDYCPTAFHSYDSLLSINKLCTSPSIDSTIVVVARDQKQLILSHFNYMIRCMRREYFDPSQTPALFKRVSNYFSYKSFLERVSLLPVLPHIKVLAFSHLTNSLADFVPIISEACPYLCTPRFGIDEIIYKSNEYLNNNNSGFSRIPFEKTLRELYSSYGSFLPSSFASSVAYKIRKYLPETISRQDPNILKVNSILQNLLLESRFADESTLVDMLKSHVS